MKVDYLINIKEKITSEFCTETLREHNIKIQCDQTLKSDYQKEPLPPSPVPEFYPSLPPSCLLPTMKSEKFLNPFQLETNIHCVENEILCIPPYSVRMRKNADQNNSEYGLFLRSDQFYLSSKKLPKYENNNLNLFSKQTSHLEAADSPVYFLDMQYWKWNNICNTWKIKENLNILVWFTCFDRFIFIYFIFPTLSPRSSWASSVDFFLKFSFLPPYYIGREGACHKTSQNVSIKRLKLCVL